jgi:hypothetical protein
MTWLGQPSNRGDWYYSCETDLGYCGALRTAATIVADDPVFGRFCFGGEMHAEKSFLRIIPRDGVRRRLYLRAAGQKIDFEVTGARFAKEEPMQCFIDKQRFLFIMETESMSSGEIQFMIAGLPAHPYKVICGQDTKEFHPGDRNTLHLRVPVGASKISLEVVRA